MLQSLGTNIWNPIVLRIVVGAWGAVVVSVGGGVGWGVGEGGGIEAVVFVVEVEDDAIVLI